MIPSVTPRKETTLDKDRRWCNPKKLELVTKNGRKRKESSSGQQATDEAWKVSLRKIPRENNKTTFRQAIM